MLDAALAYAARGLPIFPARLDKTPYTENGVIDATTDKAQIERWWRRWPDAGIALNCGEAKLLVLDFDPGHDRAELERNVAKLPKTRLRAQTPRGGTHEYYALGDGEIVPNSASKLAEHVDVRSFHGYVLLPPSRTADGAYEWLEQGKPAHRPDALIRACNTAREKSEDRDKWIIEPNLDENVAACIKWLREDARIAVEGQGGDACAYATAAMCKSFGISEELAIDLVLEHWNPRCSPPWAWNEQDHLEQKVRNAFAYNTNPPGNVTPAYRAALNAQGFKSVLKNGCARSFYYLDDLDSISEPTYIIDGVLPESGHCLLYGKRSTKKSFIALDMALSIATGQPWHGRKVKQGRVVMLAGEGFRGLRRRVKAWFQAHGLKQETYAKAFALVRLEHKLDTASGREAVRSILTEIATDGPIALVIIDTARRAMSGDENSPTQVGQFLDGVAEVCKPFGCGYLILHHAGKDDSKGARGGGPFEDDTDAVFRAAQGGGGLVVMSCTKQKDNEAGWAMKFRAEKIVVGADADGKPITSLSLTLHSESQASDGEDAAVEREQNSAAEFQDRTNQAIISKTLRDILRANKGKVWSERGLAKALAADDAIEIQEHALRKTWLPRIRGSKTDSARHCYDRMRERWIYGE